MSMQRVLNYGSYLQAMSLKNMVESLGGEVEFVDFKVDPVIKLGESKFKRLTIGKIAQTKYRLKRSKPANWVKVKILHKKVSGSDYYKDAFEILGVYKKRNERPKLDLMIVGSDEVFNCLQTNADVGYSLELFGKNNRAKKLISYAASFGNTTYERLKEYNVDSEVGKLLCKFDSISVRDNNSGSIVEKFTGKKPEYNLDPVLVGEFEDIIQDNVKIDNYIIVYGYWNRFSREEGKQIVQYAKKRGKKLVAMCGNQEFCDEFIRCTPFEVLAYFKHADEIITDTFHGSIFSIITYRPFVTIIRDTVNGTYGNREKLEDMLIRVGMQDRIVENIDDIENVMHNAINYERTDSLRKDERRKALAYLKKYIEMSN